MPVITGQASARTPGEAAPTEPATSSSSSPGTTSGSGTSTSLSTSEARSRSERGGAFSRRAASSSVPPLPEEEAVPVPSEAQVPPQAAEQVPLEEPLPPPSQPPVVASSGTENNGKPEHFQLSEEEGEELTAEVLRHHTEAQAPSEKDVVQEPGEPESEVGSRLSRVSIMSSRT